MRGAGEQRRRSTRRGGTCHSTGRVCKLRAAEKAKERDRAGGHGADTCGPRDGLEPAPRYRGQPGAGPRVFGLAVRAACWGAAEQGGEHGECGPDGAAQHHCSRAAGGHPAPGLLPPGQMGPGRCRASGCRHGPCARAGGREHEAGGCRRRRPSPGRAECPRAPQGPPPVPVPRPHGGHHRPLLGQDSGGGLCAGVRRHVPVHDGAGRRRLDAGRGGGGQRP
mmetsp:Transcript_32664/g.101968  ORF Transcript_32664/g.101968 Transcript_32664/m.101968 type:complete len:222 (+) Transcript_32664:360-1025(+)